MVGIYRIAERASRVSANVLIVGENGVGKEHLARQIHRFRDAQEKNFRVYHCHAAEMDFTEIRELFRQRVSGHTGGAPLTFFLKSIGEIDLKYQLQLLELLEEEQFLNPLANSVCNSKPRLICSCVIDNALNTNGRLQQRLAYRLDVIHIEIPPLRERREEILPLADLFLQEFKVKHGKSVSGFSPEVRTQFLMHTWPGNVRELRNIVEQGVMLAKGHVIENIFLN
jgi:DNA-binding NtrC family response regulator